MTNTSERVTAHTSERVTAQVFGLSLAAIFFGPDDPEWHFILRRVEQCQLSLFL